MPYINSVLIIPKPAGRLGTTMNSQTKAIVKNADMSDEMQRDAVNAAEEAMRSHNVEKDIAAYIKKDFDKKFNPTWHCIVGRNFGRYVVT